MDVRRESRHEVSAAVRRRYRGAGRTEKGRLIDEAAAVTGYQRRYAQALLRKGVPYGGARPGRGGRPRGAGRGGGGGPAGGAEAGGGGRCERAGAGAAGPRPAGG